MTDNLREIKPQSPVSKDLYSDISSKIDAFWVKFDRDRRNSLYVNEAIKEHLTWVAADVTESIDTNDMFQDLENKINLRGKNPQIYETVDSLLAEYSTLFKNPDALFNIEGDIDTPEEYGNVFKSYLLSKIDRSGIINAYLGGLEKELWRGENILFHEWGKRTEKRRVSKPKTDKKGNPELDENGKPQFDWIIEEFDDYEGVIVSAVEPKDFVFDITKIGELSTSMYDQHKFADASCVKIRRTWMSLSEIKSKYEIDKDDLEILKNFTPDDILPRSEQNFDDFTNRFNYRYKNGDLIEILEFWGNIYVNKEDTFLPDMRIITAGSKVVLKCESNPYTTCPFLWKPAVVDLYTRRGLSPVVTAVDYNELSTNIRLAIQESLKFALNPAYFVKKGTHLVDDTKVIKPGAFVELDDGLGNGEYPQEIDSWKNIPMTNEFFDMLEKYINKATGVSENQLGNPENAGMTATEINQISTSSSIRFSRQLLMYCNMILIPSIKIIARMFAENIDTGSIENIKVDKQVIQVTDEIRTGKYTYTIGSTQALIEKKQQISQLMPIVQGLSNPAIQQTFDIKELLIFATAPFGIQNPERFLNQQDAKTQQLQQQYQQQIQQMQIQLQQSEQQKQQLLQQPTVLANKIRNDIAALTISKDGSMPQDLKDFLMKQLSITPTSEMLADEQKEFEQNQVKQMNKQKAAMQLQQRSAQAGNQMQSAMQEYS